MRIQIPVRVLIPIPTTRARLSIRLPRKDAVKAEVIARVAHVPVRRSVVDAVRDVNVTNGVMVGLGLGHERRMLSQGNVALVVIPSNPQIHRLPAQVCPDAPDRSVCQIT
jgi:hypothetical protein